VKHDDATPLLSDYLVESARRLPDKVALTAGERRVTYAEIDGAASRLAAALRARGVARGDRVVVFGDNSIETAIAFWAVLKANAVVAVVSPLTKADTPPRSSATPTSPASTRTPPAAPRTCAR